MLRIEKPAAIYVPKLPQSSRAGVNKKINSSVNMWQKGYVRKRLAQKCKEQSVALIEVFGKDISNECSRCSAIGQKANDVFTCKACGAKFREGKRREERSQTRADTFIMKDFTDECFLREAFYRNRFFLGKDCGKFLLIKQA